MGSENEKGESDYFYLGSDDQLQIVIPKIDIDKIYPYSSSVTLNNSNSFIISYRDCNESYGQILSSIA